MQVRKSVTVFNSLHKEVIKISHVNVVHQLHVQAFSVITFAVLFRLSDK